MRAQTRLSPSERAARYGPASLFSEPEPGVSGDIPIVPMEPTGSTPQLDVSPVGDIRPMTMAEGAVAFGSSPPRVEPSHLDFGGGDRGTSPSSRPSSTNVMNDLIRDFALQARGHRVTGW